MLAARCRDIHTIESSDPHLVQVQVLYSPSSSNEYKIQDNLVIMDGRMPNKEQSS